MIKVLYHEKLHGVFVSIRNSWLVLITLIPVSAPACRQAGHLLTLLQGVSIYLKSELFLMSRGVNIIISYFCCAIMAS
jgi:hypothetical protein